MTLGTEVGLGLRQIVLNGDPAPLSRRSTAHTTQEVRKYLLWPNGSMDQDAAWYELASAQATMC